MPIFAVLVLAVSSNVDDLAAGAALGLAAFRISVFQALAVAAVSGLTLGAGMQLGIMGAGFLPDGSSSLVSLLLFSLIGLYFWLGPTTPEQAPGDPSSPLSLSVSGTLGLALVLGVDSLALGVPAGLSAYPPVATPLLAMLTSFCFFLGGNRLGRRLARQQLISRTRPLAGLLFLLLAALEASRALQFAGSMGC